MLKCPSASRCQCREGRLHLDARCEQMQGAGLHLASRCEKMQAPEQLQATDALEKSPEAPQNCIFGCSKVLYATIRHIWCFTRHIWFRSRSIPPVFSPFSDHFPNVPGQRCKQCRYVARGSCPECNIWPVRGPSVPVGHF